jgi:hypothetical protein
MLHLLSYFVIIKERLLWRSKVSLYIYSKQVYNDIKLIKYSLEVLVMKKYKHFVIGFLVGAILFSIAPVSAAIEEFLCYKADYKVMINGSEYISKDLPILNYKGNTYAPFRPILEKAGLSVNWNAELGQAEVTLNPLSAQTIEKNAATMPTTIQYDPVTGLPIGAEYVDMGMNAFNNYSYDKGIKYNGKLYVTRTYLFRKYNIS